MPFEPSNGGEPWKAMRFSMDDEGLLEAMRALEDQARGLARELEPRVQWNSVVADSTRG